MEKLDTSSISFSNGNMKCPVEKSFFCIKFAIKTLPRCCCKYWHWKAKVSLFDTTCWQNLNQIVSSKRTKFWVFFDRRKSSPLKVYFNKAWTPFLRRFCGDCNNCLIANHSFSDNFPSVFQTLWLSNTCN